MDLDDYGEIPATPGGGETPLHDEQGEEYNPEVQVNDGQEYDPEIPDDEGEYNPEITGNMEESDVESERQDEDLSHMVRSSPAYIQPGSPAGSELHSPARSGEPSSPMGSGGLASPVDSGGPASPVGSVEPHSPAISGPRSPAGSDLQSPAGSEQALSEPCSPAGSGPRSPPGSGPQSPTGSAQHSPAVSGPRSPAGSEQAMSEPHSPAGSEQALSEPRSPAGSEPRSPAGSEQAMSGPHSPAGSEQVMSEPRSPAGSEQAMSEPRSPAGSEPHSPAGSEQAMSGPHSPAGSEPHSPAGSEPRSPAGSEPHSPFGSEPRSPAGSEPHSPAGSEPRSPFGSEPRSPAGSEPDSRAGSRGRASPARSMASRSRSGSPEARPRSLSGSPRSPPHSNASSRHSSPVSKRERQRAIESDSDDNETISKTKSSRKRRRIKGSDDEGSEKEETRRLIQSDSEDEERVTKQKRKRRQSHGSDQEENEKQEISKVLPSDSEDEGAATPRTGKRKARGSDDEDSDKGSNVGGLIDDIFGKSDEEEEFEGFGEADVASYSKKDKKQSGFVSDEDEDTGKGGKPSVSILPELSSDEEGDGRKNRREDFVSDFDLMLERKKAEMAKRRRKRKDVEILNDSDDFIEDMIKKMKEAVEIDRELNKQKKPAIKVLCMLPFVKRNLLKVDLHIAMIDGGILSAITEWLAPLPDRSLPHLEVREALLKQLLEFSQISTEGLRMSGLGKAVMYLFKHPRETRANKERANRLINEWARPIFSQNSDYRTLSREEREQRDYEQLPKKRRISMEGGSTPHHDIGKALSGEEKVLRPGDPGYIYRARVPQPSNKDYVIRPKWNVEEKPNKGSGKKGVTKLDKYVRQGKKNKQTFQSAVKISIEGRNMAL